LAFACWSLQVLMLCLVPQYFARTVAAVGVCTWLADVVYVVACPKQLRIRFPGADGQMSVLDFHLGWCFYLTAAAGKNRFLLFLFSWHFVPLVLNKGTIVFFQFYL
jgi:hypothetical protein